MNQFSKIASSWVSRYPSDETHRSLGLFSKLQLQTFLMGHLSCKALTAKWPEEPRVVPTCGLSTSTGTNPLQVLSKFTFVSCNTHPISANCWLYIHNSVVKTIITWSRSHISCFLCPDVCLWTPVLMFSPHVNLLFRSNLLSGSKTWICAPFLLISWLSCCQNHGSSRTSDVSIGQ